MKQTRAQATIERATAKWRSKPSWWHEVIYVGVLYALYSIVRNFHGSVLSVNTAKLHAQDVVDFERTLGIFNELQIQQFFLPHTWAVKALDVWYGTAHFIVTIGVLLWLYHMKTERYRKWRNVIIATTFFALIGYLVYPLAPPRLLPEHYGFVDTLNTIGGVWDFKSHTVEDVSNQYAAMPSLHVAWALWCAFASVPILKHWWSRVAMIVYPMITITAIVATANHYWADVMGGTLAFALGYALAHVIEHFKTVYLVNKLHREEAGAYKQVEFETNKPTDFAATNQR